MGCVCALLVLFLFCFSTTTAAIHTPEKEPRCGSRMPLLCCLDEPILCCRDTIKELGSRPCAVDLFSVLSHRDINRGARILPAPAARSPNRATLWTSHLCCPNPARALTQKEPYRGSRIPILCCPAEPVLRDTSPSRHHTESGSCPCAHPTMCPPNTRCLDAMPHCSCLHSSVRRISRFAATRWNVCRDFDDDEEQMWQAAFTCSELSEQLTEMLLGTRDRSFIWKHLLPFCGDSAERDGCCFEASRPFFQSFGPLSIQQMQMPMNQ